MTVTCCVTPVRGGSCPHLEYETSGSRGAEDAKAEKDAVAEDAKAE